MNSNKNNSNNDGWIGVFSFFAVFLLIALLNSCGSSTTTETKEYVCRHSGCGRTPVYTDWERRFCSTHIQDDKYCRHPYCSEKIPKTSTSKYCSKHR